MKPPVPLRWTRVPAWEVGNEALLAGGGATRYRIFANGDRFGTFDLHAAADRDNRWLNVPATALTATPEEVGVAPAIEFPYTRTFNAIADAAELVGGGTAIGISVAKFQAAFNKS